VFRYDLPLSPRVPRGLIIFMWLSFVSVVHGQSKPEVKGVAPLGIPAGKTLRFVVYGENLSPKEVQIKPPLVAKLLEAKATEGEMKGRGSRQVTVEITVPANCPHETFELTLTQPDNQKATVQIAVTANVASELEVKKPNNTFAQALLLSGASVAVTGNLDNDQPALFRFEAKAGETWEITLLAGRGGSQLDAILRVRDGRRLARGLSAGHPKKDRRISFRVPNDGSYFIEVGDSQSRGGKEFTYRLSLIRK
jgi:hypothetical protein